MDNKRKKLVICFTHYDIFGKMIFEIMMKKIQVHLSDNFVDQIQINLLVASFPITKVEMQVTCYPIS